jgi:hypothetical protein
MGDGATGEYAGVSDMGEYVSVMGEKRGKSSNGSMKGDEGVESIAIVIVGVAAA